MTYYTIHIDDSGAIEDIEEKIIGKTKVVICKMYDDQEFNKLNDVLHSLRDFIVNQKALNIFEECNTIPYVKRVAKVLRKEKFLGFAKKYRSYDYFELTFLETQANKFYNYIDFEKSDVYAINNLNEKFKINSHQEKLELIEINKSNSDVKYSFRTEKIVFDKDFDLEIDLFKIPHYSWGTYVSQRLKDKIEIAGITKVGFAEGKNELGIVWKPHFPLIEFNK